MVSFNLIWKHEFSNLRNKAIADIQSQVPLSATRE